MIVIGCFALYLDIVLNIVIEYLDPKEHYKAVNIISVITTCVIHYTGYFCIIFRASRIFTVMESKTRFLKSFSQLHFNRPFNGASLKKNLLPRRAVTRTVNDCSMINLVIFSPGNNEQKWAEI